MLRYLPPLQGLLLLGLLAAGSSRAVLAEPAAGLPETGVSREGGWLKRAHLHGRLQVEAAYRLSAPRQLAKLKTLGWLEGRYDVSDAMHLRLSGRAWYDGVYDLSNNYPDNVARDQRVDLDLRQALLSVSAGSLDVRLGRQQIVWGEALGTFVTDVVNPKDVREFVLPPFTESRIPLWALDVTWNLGHNLVFEGVWTPDLRGNTLPEPGAEFAILRPPLASNVRQEPDRHPSWGLRHSQGGVRLSYLVSGWDLAVLYYDAFDATPVFFRRQTGLLPNRIPLLTLTPRHPRLHMLGATLGKSFEPVVVRAELLYTFNKHLSTTRRSDADGVVRSDTLEYLLSLDYTFFNALDTTWQCTQRWLMGSAEVTRRGAVQGRVSSACTVRLSLGALDNTLHPSLLVAVGLHRGDYRLSPRLDYLLTGAVTLALGADLFGGPGATLYGQVAARDRLYVEVSQRF